MNIRAWFSRRQTRPPQEVETSFAQLQPLVAGAQRHRQRLLTHRSEREHLAQLRTQQTPDAFVICCSDSRLTPTHIFSQPAGVLFEHRNAGNQVLIGTPTATQARQAGEIHESYACDESMQMGLEMAIVRLHVRHIVVVGHAQCGAMAGVLMPEGIQALPRIAAWLDHARELPQRLRRHYPEVQDGPGRARAAAQENVLMQLERLERHPLVREHVARGQLSLHGFVYELDNDAVLSGWVNSRGQFVPVNAPHSLLPARCR